QANNMRDRGCNVILGLRPDGESWNKAKEDGFDVYGIREAVKRGDIIHFLIPDEVQKEVYEEKIEPEIEGKDVFSVSHGFNIFYEEIEPPKDMDVVMIAPKCPGPMFRRAFEQGSAVPGLFAVENDYSGNAKEIALAMAKATGLTRVGVIETTFKEEVETDLVGEQTVLVGGVSELIKAGFETLVDADYQPENAYFEVLNELKFIVDSIFEGGIEGMMQGVSNTAEYGGRTRGSRVIDDHVKESMKELLDEVQDGTFAKEWIAEKDKEDGKLEKLREQGKEHQIEKVGKKLRKLGGMGE
ncbi:ketol-acid reductoisomerase, partial [candidate division MSBL1 archaeon SCGC-AAA382N08]